MTKRRAVAADIPPWQREGLAHQVACLLCTMAAIDTWRVQRVQLFDPNIEGRTGYHIEFLPQLTDDERARYREAVIKLSSMYGGRPPIFPERIEA